MRRHHPEPPPRRLRRRDFLRQAAATSAVALLTAPARGAEAEHGPPARPNILWVTCEDMSPNLGCCGDAYAATPNLDAFARQAVRYTHCYATNPVCSPSRSCLVTGVYATTLGTMHLRSAFPVPDHVKGFPTYLRRAGYFTSNRVKTDYNTSTAGAIIKASWDRCSAKAHWRGRKPGQPFFCVFNHTVTHQSRSMVWPYEQFRKRVQSQLAPAERHEPATAPLPPDYPDTPIVRRTVARYYDCITVMDRQVGALLQQLDDDGLADDTIVFFYSDHGAGMPRHKRLILDSGLHVPLLVRFPTKWQHLAPARPGETLGRLVSFVDFAPTVLSLAGLPVPDHMQGQAFLGAAAAEPRQYVYGARDRVDEAYDLARSVRDRRYLYVRNYMPHLSYNQPSYYSDLGEIRGEITRLAADGKLDGPQRAYAGPTRPTEELYDTQSDPHQVHNLADSPAHKPILERMRERHRQWLAATRDVAFLPEAELSKRSKGSTPYEMARHPGKAPQARIRAAADLVGGGPQAMPRQLELLGDADAAVRYWAAVGLRALGKDAAPAREALVKALTDPADCVRIEAAGALAALGHTDQALPLLTRELEKGQPDAQVQAARALELLGEAARPAIPAMKARLAALGKARGNHATYLRFALQPALRKLGQ